MQELINQALEHQQAGRTAEAEQLLIRVLESDFRNADAWHYRGVAAHLSGRNYDAVAFIERSLALEPHNVQAHYNLGVILGELGDAVGAEAAYRRVLEGEPNHLSGRHNLANLFKQQGLFAAAADCLQAAVDLPEADSRYQAGLAHALKMCGRVEEAADRFQRAVERKPGDAQLRSQWLFALQYDPRIDDEILASAHREWNERHAPADVAPVASRRVSGRPIRIGFVSPDLGNHPVGIFLLPLLERLDRERFFVACYSDHKKADEFNAQLRPHVDLWRDVWNLSDAQLTEQIRADAVDIAFDLAGHTDDNRLPVFARRVAPVQITWAGYVGTTGLATMDYLLCDRFHVPSREVSVAEVVRLRNEVRTSARILTNPATAVQDGGGIVPPVQTHDQSNLQPDAEPILTEKPLRMPHGYVVYEPPEYAPAVAELPALTAGHVTFGSMSNVCKVNEPLIDVWANIMRQVPDSRLLLKYKGFHDPGVQARFHKLFEARDVAAERILMEGQTPHVDHLAAHNRVDVGLDPFPYSGGLTTCESLWMGVPVVTCPGGRFASRHCLSHSSNAGFIETIAKDHDDYVRIAVELAGDLPRLQSIRQNLRSTMAASQLCDVDRFAADFAAAMESLLQDPA